MGGAHVSEFPKRQAALRYAQSQPRAGRPSRADPPARPFAAILRRCFDRYVLTGLPPTNEGEHRVDFFRSLSPFIPHSERASVDAAAEAVRSRDALSLSLSSRAVRVDGFPLKSWLFRFRRGPRCPLLVSHRTVGRCRFAHRSRQVIDVLQFLQLGHVAMRPLDAGARGCYRVNKRKA